LLLLPKKAVKKIDLRGVGLKSRQRFGLAGFI